jgi:hypothetical protein
MASCQSNTWSLHGLALIIWVQSLSQLFNSPVPGALERLMLVLYLDLTLALGSPILVQSFGQLFLRPDLELELALQNLHNTVTTYLTVLLFFSLIP